MDSAIAIRVESVSKTYRIWENPSARITAPLFQAAARLAPSNGGLSHRLAALGRAKFRDFTALENISFELPRGSGLGIIGRNGSGKSTLLQIVTGTLRPTSGRVSVNGRIAALLELGSGFNPDFTGRENVFLNGAVQGFTRGQMEAKFDTVAGFADIGDFMEEPLKTYSSGMAVRLAFAVAICTDPDILIVDEALSVGDVFFQQKCFRRIREILDRGTTLLFVSHDTAAVQNLCQRGILLHRGKMVHAGAPEECTSRYFSIENEKGFTAQVAVRPSDQATAAKLDRSAAEIRAANILEGAKARHGIKGMEFSAIALFNEFGRSVPHVKMGETASVYAILHAHTEVAEPAAGIRLFDRMANLVFAAGNRQLGTALPALQSGDELIIRFELGFAVNPGQFTLTLDCSEPSIEGPNFGVFHDVVEGLGPVTVYFDQGEMWPFYGVAKLPLHLEFEHLKAAHPVSVSATANPA